MLLEPIIFTETVVLAAYDWLIMSVLVRGENISDAYNI